MDDPVSRIPRRNRLRYFPRRGHRTWFDRGFQSKQQAREWIRSECERGTIDWTSGFYVQFRDYRGEPLEIVNKKGLMPKL